MSKDRGGRRSSILKPPKVRHPLTELDLKPLDIDDDGGITDTTRSRRVSFSSKKGVALFTSDHGNTIWHNIYEEANKQDLSDSGGASHFQMSMNSTKGLFELNAVNPGYIAFDDSPVTKVEDGSYNESFSTNHDRTFAILPNDSDDDEDHCVDIHAMLTGFRKPVEKELPNIIFQTTQMNFSDHTDALINYKIPLDSSTDPLCMENPRHDDKSNTPGVSTHFVKDALGGKLEVTNIAGHNYSMNQKGTTFNENQTQDIPLPIQEIKNVTLKCNSYDISYSERKETKDSWIHDKENLKVHIECHQDTDIQEDISINYGNEKSHVKITTSILDQFQRDIVLKDDLLEGCSITMKRSLPEGGSLDDSYILPDKKTRNSSDQKRTIIFNQESITQVNENLIQCKQEFDYFYPEVKDVDTVNENVKMHNSIHLSNIPNNSDCDMSFTKIKNSQNDQITDKRCTIIYNQDSSNCGMSMTRVNENLLQCEQGFDVRKDNKSTVFDREYMSMTCTGHDEISEDLNIKSFLHNNTSNMAKDSKTNIANNQVLVKTEDIKALEKKSTKTVNDHEKNLKIAKEFDHSVKMESNISIIEDFVLQKERLRNELNTVPDTCNRSYRTPTGLDSKEIDQSINIQTDVETFVKDCEMICEENASNSQLLNVQMPHNNDIKIGNCEIINPDKRKDIIFDHLPSECNMSITGIIPLRNEERQNNDSDNPKFQSNENHLQKNYDNVSTTTPCVEQVQNNDLNPINPVLSEYNVSQTSVISKYLETQNQTLGSNNGVPECEASIPSVIKNSEKNKRKSIVFDPFMPECNISTTGIITKNINDVYPEVLDNSQYSTINYIPNKKTDEGKLKLYDGKISKSIKSFTNVTSSNLENKRKSIHINIDKSMMSIVPNEEKNKRKTIIFDPEIPECNMSMTSIIPNSNESKKQTLIFDSERLEFITPMTSVIPNDQENKRKTLIFYPEMPECNISETSNVPSDRENIIYTVNFDSNMPECNTSMTSVIPSDKENKKKTFVFDPGMPVCKVSRTGVCPSSQENKKKSTIFDPEKPEFNLQMTSIIPTNQEHKRKTLIFDPGMPEFNMSMTSVISNSNENKEETPIFDSKIPEFNMQMSSVSPNDKENKRKTIIFDPGMPEFNMSMTSVIPNSNENKRETSMFDSERPEFNMSITNFIPSDLENKRKTLIFDPGMPECNMSMTSIIPYSNESKKQTLMFDSERPEFNTPVTSSIPIEQENKRKTIIFDSEMPECNMSMTSVIPNSNENKYQTFIFDSERPELNMSITNVIPGDQENKRKTIIFDPGMPECNMSMTSVIPSDQKNKRKTIIFDSEMPECNMSMTSVIPNSNENKRHTFIFDSERPEFNMSMTNVIPSHQENKRKTIIFDPGMPECNMSMTSVIPKDRENKRKTIIFDSEMPECNMSMTSVIPNSNKYEHQTFIFDSERPEFNKSITNVIPNEQENKRKTIIFDPGMPECNMTMTSVIPKDRENKKMTLIFDRGVPMESDFPSDRENTRNTVNFDSDMPECNTSMRSVIPSDQENKNKTLIFDPGMPKCKVSGTGVSPCSQENIRKDMIFYSEKPEFNTPVTSSIPIEEENKRKTLILHPEMPECNMSMTSVIPNSNENKRQTFIFDPEMPEFNMSITNVVPSDQENKRKTIIFDPEIPQCNMSMTSAIPSDQENKRKTIIFDSEMLECNTSMTGVFPSIQECKRNTEIFDPGMPGIIPQFGESKCTVKVHSKCKMSMVGAISCRNDKSIVCDPMIPESNTAIVVPDNKKEPVSLMLSTNVISSHQENPRNTVIVEECNTTSLVPDNKENPESIMLSRNVIPSHQENHRNPLIVDTECNTTTIVPEDEEKHINVSVHKILSTSVIPSHRENQKNTLHVGTEISECIKSVTNVVSSYSESESKPIESNVAENKIEDIHEMKRNTFIIDPAMPECHSSLTNEVSHNDKNVNKQTVFDSEVINKKVVLTKDMPEYNISAIREIQNEDRNEIRKNICVIESHDSIVVRNEDISMTNYVCQDEEIHMEIPDTSRLEKTLHEIHQSVKNQSLREVIVKNSDVPILYKTRNDNNFNHKVTLDCSAGFSADLQLGSLNKSELKNNISLNSNHLGSQNISVQSKSVNSATPENKFMVTDQSENDDHKNKSAVHTKNVDCSMSMTNMLPRSTHWESKNNITATSFALHNPINETTSVLFEHLDINEKMINSSKSYGIYREVSRTNDASLTESPDSKSMGELSLPSIDICKVDSRDSGIGVEKCKREINTVINVPFDDSHMSVDDVVDITLPSIDKSINVDKHCLLTLGNLEGTEENIAHLSNDISVKSCDKNGVERETLISTQLDNSTRNIQEMYAESDYNACLNLSTATRNLSSYSGDLIKTLNQDLHSETLNKSDPISKFTNANREQSDSPAQKIDDSGSSDMKMINIPVNLLETVGKRKSDHEYNENLNYAAVKKQKVLPPVCTWLKDLDGDAENKPEATTEMVQCLQTGKIEIDTKTYTITKIELEKDCSLPITDVNEKPKRVLHSRIENTEELDKNNSDHLIANISDMSLVNSSFDKSDPRDHEASPAAVHNVDKRKLSKLIESVDEIIEKQCGSSNFESKGTSNPRSSNSENFRLTNVSLCESMSTSTELTESPVRLPEWRETAQPEITSTPIKHTLEGLIRDFDFKRKLCVLEHIECNECVFLLMDGAIEMTVLLEPSPSGVRNLMRPVADVSLALTNVSAKFSKSHQMFHWLAIKMALQELEVRTLRVMCLVAADLPKLLTHCSQVISRAWSLSRQYYILYIKYNLQFDNDRWSFEICSGHLLCIWEAEIQVRSGLLPYTKPDNVKIFTVTGDSPIKDCEFKSVVQKIEPSWHYIPKLVEEIHNLVKSYCTSLSR